MTELAQGLQAAGHEVRALVVDDRPDGDESFTVRRVVCRPNSLGADLSFRLPCLEVGPRGSRPFSDLSDSELNDYRETLRRRLDAEVEQFDPQIIHCQYVWLLGYLALETGVPYVLTAHGPELKQDDRRVVPFQQQASENASGIITHTHLVRSLLTARFEGLAERVATFDPGIDVAAFAEPPPARATALAQLGLPPDLKSIVAHVGRLEPGSGVTTLLNAAAAYERYDGAIATVIIGDGPERHELELQARHQGLRQLHLLGFRSRRECALLYHVADVLVLPAHETPSTYTLVEALAAGTPVIGTKIGGVDELLPDDVGVQLPVADHELLTESILTALRDEWKQSKGPRAAQIAAKRFNRAAWIDRTLQLYRQALGDRHGTSPEA